LRVTLIGDIHQKRAMFNAEYMPPNSIQLGDLGFDYSQWDRNNRRLRNPKPGRRHFIGGNHDAYNILIPEADYLQEINPELCHIPRGYVSGKVMFIGGADSIDAHHRIPGYDWFPEERLSMMEVDCILQYEGRVDVIIAHDLPAFAYPGVGIHNIVGSHCRDLEEIFYKFRPSRWYAGHHHKSVQFSVEGCHFKVLDIGERLTVDLPLDEGFFS